MKDKHTTRPCNFLPPFFPLCFLCHLKCMKYFVIFTKVVCEMVHHSTPNKIISFNINIKLQRLASNDSLAPGGAGRAGTIKWM